jgi:hypothetical protein
MVKPQPRGVQQRSVPARPADKIEKVFQCGRCKIRFTLNLTPEDIERVTCPRSCVAEVKDITESFAKQITAIREDRLRRVAAREQQYAAEQANAKKEADTLAKKRGV